MNSVTTASKTDSSNFGWTMQGRNFVGEEYRYSYQGSEKDGEILSGNSYTTYYRNMDPRVGRWNITDPLASDYPSLSSYNSMANDPLIFVDPLGSDIYIVTKNGNIKPAKSTLLRTPSGARIWNKYANNKTHDVYITSQEWKLNKDKAAGTITHAEKYVKNDKFKFSFENKDDFSSLEDIDVSKSKGRQISIISINETFLNTDSKYDNAKKIFHEIAAHVDNPNLFLYSTYLTQQKFLINPDRTIQIQINKEAHQLAHDQGFKD